MKEITGNTYAAIAEKLRAAIGGGQFYDGTVEHIGQDNYMTLRATLIIYRSESNEITDIVPVWWEFRYHRDGVEYLTDFTFSELKKHLL